MEVVKQYFRAYHGEFVKTFEPVYPLPNDELMVDLDGNGVYDVCDQKEFTVTGVVEYRDGSRIEYDLP